MPKFTLRLPDDVYEDVKTMAEREERSLHAQVVYLLRAATRRSAIPSDYGTAMRPRPTQVVVGTRAEDTTKEPTSTEIKLMQKNADGTVSPYESAVKKPT